MIARETAHIAQKVPIDYCHARAHAFSEQLFGEDMFNQAMKRCTWESFAAVLGDLLIITEGRLRADAGMNAVRVGDRLERWFTAILADRPPPEHRREGWSDVIAAFAPRFADARTRPPAKPAVVASFSGKRMFETLPLHRRFTAVDEDAILATVQLRVGLFATTLRERVDAPAVIADLAREGRDE
jgi:hypothetical protein